MGLRNHSLCDFRTWKTVNKLPGHDPPSHTRASAATPRPCSKQVGPPCSGDGSVHVLDLLCSPKPHVTEHVSQSAHGVYPPGTKFAMKKRSKISYL